jgi:hypothetical protein
MSWRDAAKIAVFPVFFLQYLGIKIVFSFISALHMNGYNPKSQKIHAEKDGKQENK